MPETLSVCTASQRANCAALRALRGEWRSMPDVYARASARPIYRRLERELLAAISYRARVITKSHGVDPWAFGSKWVASHQYVQVIG